MDRSNSIKTTELRYTQVGEYYFPDIRLKGNVRPIRRWGRMKRDYLRAHREMLYSDLVLTGRLWPMLNEIDDTADSRLDHLMRQMMRKEEVTEELKRADQMLWIQKTMEITHRAEEVVLAELIYDDV
jgi:hypothetical protein